MDQFSPILQTSQVASLLGLVSQNHPPGCIGSSWPFQVLEPLAGSSFPATKTVGSSLWTAGSTSFLENISFTGGCAVCVLASCSTSLAVYGGQGDSLPNDTRAQGKFYPLQSMLVVLHEKKNAFANINNYILPFVLEATPCLLQCAKQHSP